MSRDRPLACRIDVVSVRTKAQDSAETAVMAFFVFSVFLIKIVSEILVYDPENDNTRLGYAFIAYMSIAVL